MMPKKKGLGERFTAWLDNLAGPQQKRKKEKGKGCPKVIGKAEFMPFLQDVEGAVKDLVIRHPDFLDILNITGKETTKWLNDLKEIETKSFRAGVCFGIYSLANSETDRSAKKEKYVV